MDEDNANNPPRGSQLNLLVLTGESQTVRAPIAADVRGTVAAETVQVAPGGTLKFGAGTNDEIEFASDLSAYTFTQQGNELVVEGNGTKATIALNAKIEVEFADGSAEAELSIGQNGPQMTVGGQVVGSSFDPSAVTLDGSDTSAISATVGGGDGGDSGESGSLVPLPSNGGPNPVSGGTSASENIDGNQSGTISGKSGADRFIFADQTTSVTISDFAEGDQVFFQGAAQGDVSVRNSDFSNGRVELSAGQVSVTLSNLGPSTDSQIFDPGSLTDALGDSALGFGSESSGGDDGGSGFPALPSAQGGSGPAAVSAGTSAGENINGNQDGSTISGGGGADRFVLTQQSTDVTIDDFQDGDQLFFDTLDMADISVTNSSFGDGQLTISGGQASVTLTNLAAATDQQIFNATTFEEQFGTRGIGTEGTPGGDPAGSNGNSDSQTPSISAQSFSVAASATAGTEIGTVQASDNVGVTAFAIVAGNTDADGDGAGAIAIGDDGSLTVGDADDVSATQGSGAAEFNLTVEAGDAAGNAGTATVTVDVTAESDGGGTTGLPGLPSEGGPATVSNGTSGGDNINGNQSGTISGAGGNDRFLFADQSTDVTVDDFATGDQLFFQKSGADSDDLNVTNNAFGDGQLEVALAQASVTLTNIGGSTDSNIFDANSFTQQFGSNALGFAGGDSGSGGSDDGGSDDGGSNDGSGGDSGGPVQSGTSASENIDGNQSGTISGNGGDDRFVFADTQTSVTIDDFNAGDSLFFEGGVAESDVAISNASFGDGELAVETAKVQVTLTNIGNADSNIFNTSKFSSEFGADALAFA